MAANLTVACIGHLAEYLYDLNMLVEAEVIQQLIEDLVLIIDNSLVQEMLHKVVESQYLHIPVQGLRNVYLIELKLFAGSANSSILLQLTDKGDPVILLYSLSTQ